MTASARASASPLDQAFDASDSILAGMFSPEFEQAWRVSRPTPKKGQGRPQAARLDNRGAAFPQGVPEEAQEPHPQRGASRWRLKAKVAKLLRPEGGERGPAVCACGTPGYEKESVRLHRRASGAGVSGIYRCDSPWLCPTCAPARAKARHERLEQVIEATSNLGGSCAFVTLTLRHDHALTLSRAKGLLSEASRRARQGRRWVALKEEGELLGVVQGVEVLHSVRTGWHYHAHLLVPGMGSPKAVLAAAGGLISRYLEEVKRLGGSATISGQDVQLVRDGEAALYASKGSAAWEVAGGAKEARSAVSRTPWDLATLAALGDEQARALFLEYAEVMPGTRSCVVSPAIAKALEIDPSEDEDEPGEQQLDEDDSVVGDLPSPMWKRILGRGVAWRVLAAVEAHAGWLEIETLARTLGAEDPAPPRRVDLIDVRRVVVAVRARGGGSSASRSRYIDEAIAEQRAEVERKGRVLRVADFDRRAIEREFIRQGLDAAM